MLFFVILVSVLCNLRYTHTLHEHSKQLMCWCVPGRCSRLEQRWQCMNTCRRKATSGWPVEVLKLSSCSECLWSQNLSFPSLSHKTWGLFCSLWKIPRAQCSGDGITLLFQKNYCISWQENIFLMKITLKRKASHIFKLCLDILASKKHWAPKHALPMTI